MRAKKTYEKLNKLSVEVWSEEKQQTLKCLFVKLKKKSQNQETQIIDE